MPTPKHLFSSLLVRNNYFFLLRFDDPYRVLLLEDALDMNNLHTSQCFLLLIKLERVPKRCMARCFKTSLFKVVT